MLQVLQKDTRPILVAMSGIYQRLNIDRKLVGFRPMIPRRGFASRRNLPSQRRLLLDRLSQVLGSSFHFRTVLGFDQLLHVGEKLLHNRFPARQLLCDRLAEIAGQGIVVRVLVELAVCDPPA